MTAPSEDQLDSWKAIAAYLNRGVRTVRRWERDEGLPVHRHRHRVLGSVYAYKSEIDEWRRTSRGMREAPRAGADGRGGTASRTPGAIRTTHTEEIAAIEARVARVILDALELRLAPDERIRLADRRLNSAHAYECYRRARQEGWRWRKDAIDHAVQTLRNGLALVGDNVLLLAALGQAFLQYREAGVDLGETPLDEARACTERIFALEPASASGLQLRGWMHFASGRPQEAVRDLKSALRLDANNADTLLLLSNCYLISGRVPDARPLIARLASLDPLTPLTRCMPAFADLLEGRFADAVDPYRQMFEMDPGNPMARLFYVWVLTLNRRVEAVVELVERFPSDLQATVPGRIATFLGRSLAGDARAADVFLTPEVETAARVTDVFPRLLAHGFAIAGDADRSIEWLAVAVGRGFVNYPFLARHDPFVAPLRTHPSFAPLMETVRERWERFEA